MFWRLNRWFENTAIILFLNKIDLFSEKIKHKTLRQPNPVPGEPDLFATYSGPQLNAPGIPGQLELPLLNELLSQCSCRDAVLSAVCVCVWSVGGLNYQAGIDYITKQFLERSTTSGKRSVFVKATCATDKTNVKTVFNSCKAVILEQNMKGSGFMEP